MNCKNCEDDIIFLIKILNKALRDDFDNRLAEHGLTSQQGRILFYVYKQNCVNKDVHQNDIEKDFELSKSTVHGLVARLQKNGFLTKANDYPFNRLVTSEKTYQAIESFKNHRKATISKLLNGYNQQEKELLIENIQKLIKNIKEEI